LRKGNVTDNSKVTAGKGGIHETVLRNVFRNGIACGLCRLPVPQVIQKKRMVYKLLFHAPLNYYFKRLLNTHSIIY